MTKSILLACLLLSSSAAAAQIFAETDDTPTPETQCATLCRRVYAADPEKVEQCLQGCDKASRCTKDCSNRFPDDEETRGRCNYRCARVR